MHSASLTCLLNPNFKQKIIKKKISQHGILSPPQEDGWGGVIFQGQWGVCFFIWAMGELLYMGGVTISNFPGELQY